jgi:hypothetical protein
VLKSVALDDINVCNASCNRKCVKKSVALDVINVCNASCNRKCVKKAMHGMLLMFAMRLATENVQKRVALNFIIVCNVSCNRKQNTQSLYLHTSISPFFYYLA